MRIGFASDWTGAAAQRVVIVAETVDGRFVCKHAPIEMTDINGKPYLAESLTGLFLREKSEITDIADAPSHKEITPKAEQFPITKGKFGYSAEYGVEKYTSPTREGAEAWLSSKLKAEPTSNGRWCDPSWHHRNTILGAK